MQLPDGEPAYGNWQAVDDDALRGVLDDVLPHGRRVLALIDGRSGSGKTTFAGRLAALLDGDVVHTDDIAWHLHPTDWDAPLIDHVIRPWQHGTDVDYRPPAWVERGRPGAVRASAQGPLIIEGVGAARESLTALADLAVWVQSDLTEARRRGIARDVEQGRSPEQAAAFWDEWSRAEDPFIAASQPWERAGLIVNGTAPQRDSDVVLLRTCSPRR